MNRISGRILRSEEVELSGRFVIGPGGPATGRNEPEARTEPQAHVVERHPEYAVIEVGCSCGAKMYLRCDYAVEAAGRDGQAVAAAAS